MPTTIQFASVTSEACVYTSMDPVFETPLSCRVPVLFEDGPYLMDFSTVGSPQNYIDWNSRSFNAPIRRSSNGTIASFSSRYYSSSQDMDEVKDYENRTLNWAWAALPRKYGMYDMHQPPDMGAASWSWLVPEWSSFMKLSVRFHDIGSRLAEHLETAGEWAASQAAHALALAESEAAYANSCLHARDGTCDEVTSLCTIGTDTDDCHLGSGTHGSNYSGAHNGSSSGSYGSGYGFGHGSGYGSGYGPSPGGTTLLRIAAKASNFVSVEVRRGQMCYVCIFIHICVTALLVYFSFVCICLNI